MGPEEQRELKTLLDRLERFELPGDVGRMVFLALENAVDEREQASTPLPHADQVEHEFERRLRRILGPLLSR